MVSKNLTPMSAKSLWLKMELNIPSTMKFFDNVPREATDLF